MAGPLDRVRAEARQIGARLVDGRAGWSLVVELLQLASSGLIFIGLVRFMDTETYGSLGGLLALAFPALSIATVGTHFLLLRRSSQGHDLDDAWSRAITVGFVGPVLVAGAMIALQPLFLPNIDPWAYALVFIGNLPLYWVNELAVYLGVGSGHMKRAAQARAILVAARFAALGWFAIWGGGELVAWAAASAVSFGVGAIGAMIFVMRAFGVRFRFARGVGSDVTDGIPFSANSVNEGLVDASDRWLLTRYDKLTDAGLYSLGGRVVQLGYLPLRTLLRTFDAELFGAGKNGVAAALAVTRRMAVPGMAIAVAVTLGFVLLAPVVPVIAGPEYDETVDVIRLLALLPVLRMMQYLVGNTLSAADRQWWRTGATAVAVVVNLGLNAWFLRDGGWRTAVVTTFVSELLLAGLLAVVLVRLLAVERSAAAGADQAARPSER